MCSRPTYNFIKLLHIIIILTRIPGTVSKGDVIYLTLIKMQCLFAHSFVFGNIGYLCYKSNYEKTLLRCLLLI